MDATIQELFEEALDVSEAMEDFIDCIDEEENREAFSAYENYWDDAHSLFSEWGVEDNAELLGALCSIPRADAREGLQGIAKDFEIPAILAANDELREEVFTAIQTHIRNYHIDLGNCTKPTKENMSKIAKMLATAFETLGYGLNENGLMVILRALNNESTEGLFTDWYNDDSDYDAEDFGYYDGIENEKIHDEFFAQHSIKELLQ